MAAPRLLQITHALYPQASGGVELYAWECARALGGAVYSLTPHAGRRPEEWNGMEVFAPRPGESVAAAWRRTLAAVEPEAVLVQHLGSASPVLLEPLGEQGIPYAVFAHDFTQICPTHKLWHRRDTACYGPGATGFRCAWCVAGAPRRWVELPARTWRYQHRPTQWHQAMARAQLIVTETRFLRDFWIEQGAPPERIAVLPVRLPEPPPPLLGPTPVPRSLLYVGGWGVAKGAELLAEALDQIGTPVRLEVAGHWDADALAAMQRVLAPRHALTNHGLLAPAELRACLRAVRAVVMPSRWQEAYGRIAAEAQQLGVPIAATAVGGVPERIIHGVNGFLARPDDATSLAAAIEQAFAATAESGWDAAEVVRNAKREAEDALLKLRQMVELLAAAGTDSGLEPALELEHGAVLKRGSEERGRLVAALRACGDEGEGAAAESDMLAYAWSATRLRRVHLNHAIAFFRGLGCRQIAIVDDACGDAGAWFFAWGLRPAPEVEAEGVFFAEMPGHAALHPDWRSRFPCARAAIWFNGTEIDTDVRADG